MADRQQERDLSDDAEWEAALRERVDGLVAALAEKSRAKRRRTLEEIDRLAAELDDDLADWPRASCAPVAPQVGRI